MRNLTGSRDCENILISTSLVGRLLPKNHSFNLLKNMKSKTSSFGDRSESSKYVSTLNKNKQKNGYG